MAIDAETNQKLPLNRRAALRAIALGAAGVTLAACGGATTPAAAPTAAPAAAAATAAPAAAAPTAAPAESAPTAAAGEPTPEPTPVVNALGSGAKTVVFWHGLGGADGATMQEMLKSYAAAKGDRTVRSETYD